LSATLGGKQIPCFESFQQYLQGHSPVSQARSGGAESGSRDD